MIRLARTTSRRVWTRLPRIWWGSLIAIHVPILLAVCSSMLLDGLDLSRVGNAIVLILALGFFALKYQDAWFLRLRTRQQSFVAVCLLAALFHHDVVSPALVDEETAAQVTAVVVSSATVWHLARRRPSWLTRLAALLARPALPLAAVLRRRARTTDLDPRRTILVHLVPRAPPA
ncbi:MAG: hypothetical protein ACYTG1_12190 [Planctomycetota bacterium]|jgi:hypothetical protein